MILVFEKLSLLFLSDVTNYFRKGIINIPLLLLFPGKEFYLRNFIFCYSLIKPIWKPFHYVVCCWNGFNFLRGEHLIKKYTSIAVYCWRCAELLYPIGPKNITQSLRVRISQYPLSKLLIPLVGAEEYSNTNRLTIQNVIISIGFKNNCIRQLNVNLKLSMLNLHLNFLSLITQNP